MQPFTVLYRDRTLRPLDSPYAFVCEADNGDHAEEQCVNADPGCEVVWVVQTQSFAEALRDYYG